MRPCPRCRLPVAAKYEKRLVRHAGVFRMLEDELYAFGTEEEDRVDRVDALVWAVTELLGRKLRPPPAARHPSRARTAST